MRLIALIAVALLVLGGISAINAALATAGDHTTIQNETFEPDPGNVTTLDESNRDDAYYDRTVDVYDENSTEMAAGDDYQWHDSNGTIQALEGGGLDGDSSATITYGYSEPTEVQQGFAGLFAGGLNIGGLLVFVLGVALVIAVMSVLGRVS